MWNVHVLYSTTSIPTHQGRLWLTQHGDAVDEDVLHGMPIADKRDLAHMMDAADYTHARDAIIICHSEPGMHVMVQWSGWYNT